MPVSTYVILIIAALFFIVLLAKAVNKVPEYKRVSHFRFGRFIGVKGPGVVLIIPFIDDLEWKDLRVRDMDVSEQNIITKDNVSANVDAVAYMKVFDPKKATLEVKDHYRATSRLAQTTLRDVLGKVELDELLSRREELAEDIRQIIDEETDAWGVKVTNMTIRNVNLPKDMVRAIASQAEAERNRRARVKKAQGEEEAAKKMADAAEIYGEREGAMRLRELQTLVEIATEQNLVVVTPSKLGSDLGNVAGLTTALDEYKEKDEEDKEQ